jgi:hypothetical protein
VGGEGCVLFSRRLGLEVLAPAWSAASAGR